jgi:hypothetical protein
MEFEDKYMNVLQNIECAIINAWKRHRELCDYDVMRTIEALIDVYVAEKVGRPPRESNLSPTEQEMMSQVRHVCEWRLGRRKFTDDPDEDLPDQSKPITPDELIRCLKRILKSVKMWNKEGGRRGYLTFVSQYVR